MKQFLKTNSIIITMLIACVITSCQKEMPSEQHVLDISSYTAPYLLSSSDMRTFDIALRRFGFYTEDGILKHRAQSAQSIGISDKLYKYIVGVVEKGNDPLTKTTRPTDCVARALAWWGSFTYERINAYITLMYGDDGVPEENVFEVITHFYPNAQQCTPDSLNADFVPNIQTTLGYFETEEPGNAHMVNICSIDSLDVVTYVDMQNNGRMDSLDLSCFSMIYIKPTD